MSITVESEHLYLDSILLFTLSNYKCLVIYDAKF